MYFTVTTFISFLRIMIALLYVQCFRRYQHTAFYHNIYIHFFFQMTIIGTKEIFKLFKIRKYNTPHISYLFTWKHAIVYNYTRFKMINKVR